MKSNIYIDGANLHKASKQLGFDMDYKKFRGWLSQKYKADKIYLFLGLIPANTKLYEFLQEVGFILIFKQTVSGPNGEIKGNCDAELVLKVVSDFYKNNFTDCLLVTGDGDFACLVDFLKLEKSNIKIVAPDKNKCSILLKRTNCSIFYLNDHYTKFIK